MRLVREYRFFCGNPAERKPLNTWAGTAEGSPTTPYWTLRAGIDGPIDPKTGYVCDIKRIDDLLRANVQSSVAPLALRGESLAFLSSTLNSARQSAGDSLPSGLALGFLELALSPHTRITVEGVDPVVMLTQSFEFAASHRLSCPNLSDAENLRLFGKCSYPHGHGHNYVVEVTLGGAVHESGSMVNLPYVDRVVRERVIEPFDHRNLNLECAEFATLNPTVENIARVIWQRLVGAFSECRLARVRVWETPKTYAEYGGE